MQAFTLSVAVFCVGLRAVAGDFVMDDVECEGDEADLTDCQHSVAHNCGVTEGAGVRCSARKLD